MVRARLGAGSGFSDSESTSESTSSSDTESDSDDSDSVDNVERGRRRAMNQGAGGPAPAPGTNPSDDSTDDTTSTTSTDDTTSTTSTDDTASDDSDDTTIGWDPTQPIQNAAESMSDSDESDGDTTVTDSPPESDSESDDPADAPSATGSPSDGGGDGQDADDPADAPSASPPSTDSSDGGSTGSDDGGNGGYASPGDVGAFDPDPGDVDTFDPDSDGGDGTDGTGDQPTPSDTFPEEEPHTYPGPSDGPMSEVGEFESTNPTYDGETYSQIEDNLIDEENASNIHYAETEGGLIARYEVDGQTRYASIPFSEDAEDDISSAASTLQERANEQAVASQIEGVSATDIEYVDGELSEGSQEAIGRAALADSLGEETASDFQFGEDFEVVEKDGGFVTNLTERGEEIASLQAAEEQVKQQYPDLTYAEDFTVGLTEDGEPNVSITESGREQLAEQEQQRRAGAVAVTSGSGELARGIDATDFGNFDEEIAQIEQQVEEQNPGMEAGEDFNVGINESGEFTVDTTEQYEQEQTEQQNEAIETYVRTSSADMETMEARTGRDIDGDGETTTASDIVAEQYESQLEEQTGANLSSEDVTTRKVTEDGETRVVGELTQSGQQEVESEMETSSFTAKVPEGVPLIGGLSQTIAGQARGVDVETGADGQLNVETQERDVFGNWENAPWQTFERGVGTATGAVADTAQDAARLAEVGIDSYLWRMTGETRDTAAGNAAGGAIEGVGQLPSAAGTAVTEGPELAVELATNPAAREALPDAVVGSVAQTGEFAAENPARFAGSVGGSAALSAAAAPAVLSQVRRVSPRAARAGEFALDPVRVTGQNVRRATSAARNSDMSLPDAGPDVSLVRDSDSGILDVTPEARAEIRETVTPSRSRGDTTLSDRIEATRQRAAVELTNAELRRQELANRVSDLSIEDAVTVGERAARRAQDELVGTAQGAAVSTEAALLRAGQRARDFDPAGALRGDSDQLLGPIEGRALGAAATAESTLRRARGTSLSDLAPSRSGASSFDLRSRVPGFSRQSGDSGMLGPIEGRVLGAGVSGEAAIRRVLDRDFEDFLPSRGDDGLLGPVEGRALGTAASVEAAVRRAGDADAGDVAPSLDVGFPDFRDLTIRVEPSRPPRTPFTRTVDADADLTDSEADVFETMDGDSDGDATNVDASNEQFTETESQTQGQQTVQVAETEAEATARSIDDGPLADYQGSVTSVDELEEEPLDATEDFEDIPTTEDIVESGETVTGSVEETTVLEETSGTTAGVGELEESGVVEEPTDVGATEGTSVGVTEDTTMFESELEATAEIEATVTPSITEAGLEPTTPNRPVFPEEEEEQGMNTFEESFAFDSDRFDSGIASVDELEEQFDQMEDPAADLEDMKFEVLSE